jgi:hypothetical protein
VAEVKKSVELIIRFNKEYLSGEGNVIQHLANLGYAVSHVQTYIGKAAAVADDISPVA